MIKPQLAECAIEVFANVTEALEHNELKITTVTTEPGSDLSDIGASMVAKPIDQNPDSYFYAKDITKLSLPISVDLQDMHTLTLAEAAADLRLKVDGVFDFAVNHANPIIKSAFESVSTFLAEGDDADRKRYDESSFSLIKDSLHPLLESDAFYEVLNAKLDDKGSYRYTVEEECVINSGGIDATEFFDTIKTGFDDVDDMLHNLIEESHLGGFVNGVITGSVESRRATIEDYIMCFLTANYLTAYPQTVISKGDLKVREQNMFSASQYYASLIVGSLNEREAIVKSKRLVKRLDAESKTVVVYPEVFDQWVEAGGSTEALFGIMILKPELDVVPYNYALENKGDFINAYKEYNVSSLAKRQEMRASRTSIYLKKVLSRTIKEHWDEFEDSRCSNEFDVSVLDRLDDVDYSGISASRLFMYVRDVLCQTLWIRSATHTVLKYIDKTHTLVDAAEDKEFCSNLVKTYLITDIVSGQLRIQTEK